MNMEDQQQRMNQQLYAFRYLKEQREFFMGQIELINTSYNNLINTKNTLENLKNVKQGDEILVPIGGILNLKANIKDPDKSLFYVGNDVVIEKSIEESIETVEKLMEQHKEQVQKLQETLQQIENNLQAASQELQRFMPQQ